MKEYLINEINSYSTTEYLLILSLLILLVLVITFPTKTYFQTPNSKLNYIMAKYRIRLEEGDLPYKLEELLSQHDKKVPQSDKKIIVKLLQDEWDIYPQQNKNQ